jgi:hypothetical protein
MQVIPLHPDKKTTASIPFRAAALCALILCIVCVSSVLTGNPVPSAGIPYSQAGTQTATTLALPQTCQPAFIQVSVTPVIPEPVEAETLQLRLPPADDRIPYTARGFDEPAEAAIAWWMSPGFMDNTSEFRRYERTAAEGKQRYPEEHRVFFTFIQNELDAAEEQSVLSTDHLLFRGISPSFAGTVMNTSRYHEPAFASTSYDIAVPLDTFGGSGPDGYRNVMVLEREAGEHALYISEDQREYLLPRGTEWTVTRTVSVENLTVTADFPLYNRSAGTESFDQVRLIYIRPAACL